MPTVDTSYAHTDAKEHQNLMALTADGALKGLLYAQAVTDVGSLADGVGETKTITVPGARLGDIVMASFSVDAQDMIVTAYVASDNSVEVRVQNEGAAGAINLASSAIMRVLVFQVA